MSAAALQRIERAIPDCTRCPRLVDHLEALRRRFPDYWCRPVPGLGDRRPWMVIVGLAPGLHGANRSGRPFWLDASGRWLYDELQRHGLWDGRRLSGAYILNALKCVPPQNRPTGLELDTCRSWLAQELAALADARVVLALGAIAHRSVLKSWGVRPLSRYPFAHGAQARIEGRPTLLASYHPSRQNTQTGVLTPAMWRGIFGRALRLGAAPRTPRSTTGHARARPRSAPRPSTAPEAPVESS